MGAFHRPRATADYARAVIDHRIDLAEDGGTLVALVEGVVRPGHLLIENLAVDPAAQGQGIGAMLLAHAEDIARSLHLGEVQLYTNALFAANICFYTRHGYGEFRRAELVPGSVAVFMRKEIDLRRL